MTEISRGDGISQQLRASPGVQLILSGEITLPILTRSSGIFKNEKADFGIPVQEMSQPIILNC